MAIRIPVLLAGLLWSTSVAAQQAVPAKGPDEPHHVALFRSMAPGAVADRILAACKARNFRTRRTENQVTCETTRLQRPKDGSLLARLGRDDHPDELHQFNFVVEPLDGDSVVFEISFSLMHTPIPPPPLTERQKADMADVVRRAGRFLVGIGGDLQPGAAVAINP
jgi:hypothetical protein